MDSMRGHFGYFRQHPRQCSVLSIQPGGRFREDDEGLTHIIEFSLAMVIVIFILAGYFTAVDNEFILHTPDDSKRQDECIRFSDLIIGDTGSAKLDANTSTTHWETLGPVHLGMNLTRPGLAMENSNFGIISLEKVLGLRNVTYNHLRSILSIRKYNFNIEITEIDGTTIAFFGHSQEGGAKVSGINRVLLLRGGERDRPVSFIFRLFEGVNRRTLLQVNEFMYFPDEGKNEWIELYNPSDEAVNLSSFALYSQRGQTFRDLLEGDTFILPGHGYALIADDAETWNQYNITAGTIKFIVADGNIGKGGLSDTEMDFFFQGETFRSKSYSYNNTLGGNGNGRSLEWSLVEGGWKQSAFNEGTPGSKNSVA